MVDVEVMESAKHPLSLFIDSELEAQVKYSFITQSFRLITSIFASNQTFHKQTQTPDIISILLPPLHSLQVARFPFTKLMSLLVVMPLSGQVNVSSLSEKLNFSDVYNRLPKERAVQVKVPKFKLEYAQELKDVFTNLGNNSLFCPTAVFFSTHT